MSLSDCLLDLLLVAVVVRQVRGRPLTTRTLVLPLVIVGVAAGEYLRSVPTAGNDPWLVAGGVVGGVLLGTACAALTTVGRRADGVLVATTSLAGAALWVVGVGARTAFGAVAEHGGGAAVLQFDRAHGLTGFDVWTAALILMSLAEVLSRSLALGLRGRAVSRREARAAGPAALTG